MSEENHGCGCLIALIALGITAKAAPGLLLGILGIITFLFFLFSLKNEPKSESKIESKIESTKKKTASTVENNIKRKIYMDEVKRKEREQIKQRVSDYDQPN